MVITIKIRDILDNTTDYTEGIMFNSRRIDFTNPGL